LLAVIFCFAKNGVSKEQVMRALRFTAFGDPLVLELAKVSAPASDQETAVVRVLAASINPSDVKNVAGAMSQTILPRIPGRDYAGLVEAGPVKRIKCLQIFGLSVALVPAIEVLAIVLLARHDIALSSGPAPRQDVIIESGNEPNISGTQIHPASLSRQDMIMIMIMINGTPVLTDITGS
jgi:hypothetical protein